MNNLESNIFGNKKFSDLLEEIYNNQKKKEKQISALIKELQPMVKELGDATLVVPLIAEYLDIGVRNDDLLIKMASIIQKFFNSKTLGDDGNFNLSDSDKDQLLADIKKLNEDK